MFHAIMAVKTYIVTFRWHKNRRPAKFIVGNVAGAAEVEAF
jgi:hypothetical protein